MSVTAGIIVSTAAVCTTAWATVGDRIARIPTVSRVVAYLDGGFNVPSDAEVDELVDVGNRRRANGIADRDDLVPGPFSQTHAESYESAYMLPCVSETAIDAAPRYKRERSCVTEDVGTPPGPVDFVFPAAEPQTGWRGWFAGGYNIPTESEIDSAPPYTMRGRHRRPIPDGWIFEDEDPIKYQHSLDALFGPRGGSC